MRASCVSRGPCPRAFARPAACLLPTTAYSQDRILVASEFRVESEVICPGPARAHALRAIGELWSNAHACATGAPRGARLLSRTAHRKCARGVCARARPCMWAEPRDSAGMACARALRDCPRQTKLDAALRTAGKIQARSLVPLAALGTGFFLPTFLGQARVRPHRGLRHFWGMRDSSGSFRGCAIA